MHILRFAVMPLLSQQTPHLCLLIHNIQVTLVFYSALLEVSKMNQSQLHDTLSKVPAVTLGFWIIKILATTLGETGGDTVSMSYTDMVGLSHDAGYVIGTAIFLPLLAVLVFFQIKARGYHPFLYWATIIASTMAGTTMADYATRSMGIGYTGGSLLLFGCVLASLFSWRKSEGSIASDTISSPKAEAFYWLTITFSQTLGTALGDWAADTGGLGYIGAAGIFAVLLVAVAVLYYKSSLDRVILFWAAFILTRPLGAAVGDLLDKPLDKGGLDFSRPFASFVLALAILILIFVLPQRSGTHSGEKTSEANS
jgi:uncharacterized membrane-anchored protein